MRGDGNALCFEQHQLILLYHVPPSFNVKTFSRPSCEVLQSRTALWIFQPGRLQFICTGTSSSKGMSPICDDCMAFPSFGVKFLDVWCWANVCTQKMTVIHIAKELWWWHCHEHWNIFIFFFLRWRSPPGWRLNFFTLLVRHLILSHRLLRFPHPR